jgi:hypothetical protein
LEGRLPLDVVSSETPLATIADIQKRLGHSVLLRPGLSVNPLRVSWLRDHVQVDLQMAQTNGPLLDRTAVQFAATDGAGRALVPTAAEPTYFPVARGRPGEEIQSWFAGAGAPPWGGLALLSAGQYAPRHSSWHLRFLPPPPGEKRLTLHIRQVSKQRVEVPFTLENIPLP